jgi:hypothetical protein
MIGWITKEGEKMRQLVIDRFKEVVKNTNDFHSREKGYVPAKCPDFDTISDQELLDQFMELLFRTSAPCG